MQHIIYLGIDMMGDECCGLFAGTEEEAAEWSMRDTRPHYFFYEGDLNWLLEFAEQRERALQQFMDERKAESNAAILAAIKADHPEVIHSGDLNVKYEPAPSWWRRAWSKIRGV